MCNVEGKVLVAVKGSDIKAGDILQVWWFGKADRVRQIEDYRGPIEATQGNKIAVFDNNRCGMEIRPDADYKVFRDPVEQALVDQTTDATVVE